MMRVLVSWIGLNDLRAARNSGSGVGPLCRLLSREAFDIVYVLNDLNADRCREKAVATTGEYREWLFGQDVRVDNDQFTIVDVPPLGNNYRATWELTEEKLIEVQRRHGADAQYHILLSPGQPAMQVALVLAGRTLGEPTLWNTWQPALGDEGVERIDWPIVLTVDSVGRSGTPAAWIPDWADSFAGERSEPFLPIVGRSQAILQTIGMANRLARVVDPVMLVGETGTGKELFAKGIHAAGMVNGRKGKLVSINCAGLPEPLLESELFGHVRGAFTGAHKDKPGLFEVADNGTLFLDEIGDMPLPLQAKLLRALQESKIRRVGDTAERTVNVRIVAATHRDLAALCRDGRFRDDLRFRLTTFTVRVPPLRERGDDVVSLAEHFLQTATGESTARSLDDSARTELKRYWWPGNVRELQQVVRRLVVLLPSAVTTIKGSHVRGAIENVATFFGDRPLHEMTPSEYLTRLAADFDELVRRFPRDLPQPRRTSDKDRLLEEFVVPLLLGRAYELEDKNGVRAGQRLGRSKLEAGKGEWLEDYQHLAKSLNQALLKKERNDGRV